MFVLFLFQILITLRFLSKSEHELFFRKQHGSNLKKSGFKLGFIENTAKHGHKNAIS